MVGLVGGGGDAILPRHTLCLSSHYSCGGKNASPSVFDPILEFMIVQPGRVTNAVKWGN